MAKPTNEGTRLRGDHTSFKLTIQQVRNHLSLHQAKCNETQQEEITEAIQLNHEDPTFITTSKDDRVEHS